MIYSLKKYSLMFLGLVGVTLMQCDSGQKEKTLQLQIDSLQSVLQSNQQWIEALSTIGSLMDSIDASRRLLRVNIIEGATYDDYVLRMKNIKEYINNVQQKIEKLETGLKKSKNISSALSFMTHKLKEELQVKTYMIKSLEEKEDLYKDEKQSLIEVISMQEDVLDEKIVAIQKKERELLLIEKRAQKLIIESKKREAISYYARGEILEETAKRTKLAHRKKKNTYMQALEMYRKSFSLGYQKAKPKISDLEESIR